MIFLFVLFMCLLELIIIDDDFITHIEMESLVSEH